MYRIDPIAVAEYGHSCISQNESGQTGILFNQFCKLIKICIRIIAEPEERTSRFWKRRYLSGLLQDATEILAKFQFIDIQREFRFSVLISGGALTHY